MVFRCTSRLVSALLCCLLAVYARAQSATPTPPPATQAAQPTPDDNGESHISLRSLPKNILEDQEAFLTTPFRIQSENLFFVVPAIFATSILVGTDTKIEAHLPKSTSTINLAANASNAGMGLLLGAGAGLFLLGEKHQDDHERETGFLAGEAALDAYIDATAFKYLAGRERPDTGNNRGDFFSGGDSFPSDTSAVSWAAASVIAHEYPGWATQLLSYGTASGVSLARVVGQKHWVSDAVVGSALGWYMGRQIYRA
jgi:membrane-associated phospholipid phosphatase